MYIKELYLTNFRGFDDIKLSFHDDINVLIGENGAGKSSALDALALLLSWFVARLKGSSISGRPIVDMDIKNNSSFALIGIQVLMDDALYGWKLSKTAKGKIKRSESDLSRLNELTKDFQIRFEENDHLNFPLLVYYPVNRVVAIDIPERIKTKHSFESALSGYDDSLVTGGNFRLFFEWFKYREDLENENRVDNDNSWRDPQLNAVRNAIAELTGFHDLRIRRSPLRMELIKGNEKLIVNQLSDGEKCLLAMVGDLARRLAIANPGLNNPLEGQGIILIDEVELHMHPAWQRRVIPGLKSTFPNCQFIVTTHSPQVVSHIEAEKVSLLSQTNEGIGVFPVNEAYGKTSDRILEDLMGVSARPSEIREGIRELFRTIDNGELEKARFLTTNLREKIGEDPDLVRAEVLIRRKEIIGR